MARYQVRAVVFKDDDWWIAQCLEYDLVSAARRPEDLKGELLRQLEFQVTYSLNSGQEPFAGFCKAPARYWKMYEELQSFATHVALKRNWIRRLFPSSRVPVIEAHLVPAAT